MESIPQTAPRTAASVHAIDVDRERRLTAGARLSSHFNAAGAALPSRAVVETVVDHLRREESMGGYEAAAYMRPAVEAVYDSAARLIGAKRDEIALLDSASTGLRVVLDALRLARGQRIIAAASTYVSHALHLMTLARENGIELVIAPSDRAGRVDLQGLETLLSAGAPAIVTVAHVPTSSGLIEPVEEIGRLVRAHGGIFVLDATQSVGHLVADVVDIDCDVLVTTGRKFLRAPRGTGFAYVRSELLARLTPTAPDVRGATWTAARDWELDDTARRFETWEAAIATRLGLGAAIDEALERGIPATQAWLLARAESLRAALAAVEGVRITDPSDGASAITTFVVEGVAAPDVVAALASERVRVVSVPATHGQWDLGSRAIPAVVRASVHVYNNENDIATLVEAVGRIARAEREARE